MTEESVRQALSDLPIASVPERLTARLRVIASHERERRVRRFGWLDRLRLEFNNMLRPLAVPAGGGLLASLILFGSIADTLNVRRYLLTQDVPFGIHTAVAVDQLSPFAGNGGDIMVEVTIDENGRPSDFSVANGVVSRAQLRQIANLVLYSKFKPATADGQPVSGKILVTCGHINVKG